MLLVWAHGLSVCEMSREKLTKIGANIIYRCWIGGSCNADGTNGRGACGLPMNANWSALTMDIFEFYSRASRRGSRFAFVHAIGGKIIQESRREEHYDP
jgi:hypothetical protein